MYGGLGVGELTRLQIPLTDPTARAMASADTGTALVGYNLQAAVDTGNHIVVAHKVTTSTTTGARWRTRGVRPARRTCTDRLIVSADRGYFWKPEVLACEGSGIVSIPRPLTSGAKANGHWGKQAFVYRPASDTHRCPAGETMTRRFSNVEHGMTLHAYAPAVTARPHLEAIQMPTTSPTTVSPSPWWIRANTHAASMAHP